MLFRALPPLRPSDQSRGLRGGSRERGAHGGSPYLPSRLRAAPAGVPGALSPPRCTFPPPPPLPPPSLPPSVLRPAGRAGSRLPSPFPFPQAASPPGSEPLGLLLTWARRGRVLLCLRSRLLSADSPGAGAALRKDVARQQLLFRNAAGFSSPQPAGERKRKERKGGARLGVPWPGRRAPDQRRGAPVVGALPGITARPPLVQGGCWMERVRSKGRKSERLEKSSIQAEERCPSLNFGPRAAGVGGAGCGGTPGAG